MCRFPDFTLLSKTGNYTAIIDCIIITHFHLDHLGALPFFTEVRVPESGDISNNIEKIKRNNKIIKSKIKYYIS